MNQKPSNPNVFLRLVQYRLDAMRGRQSLGNVELWSKRVRDPLTYLFISFNLISSV